MYEYKTKFYRANDEMIDTRLNEVAKERWRVVSITNENNSTPLRVVFERKVLNRTGGGTR